MMVNFLVAAAMIAAQPGADADPALFVVGDRDTTVYIFGTFHALDGQADWFNDEIRTAFDQSGELILETVVPEPGAVPTPNFGGPLRNSPVTPSASFLATTKMAIDAGRSQGMKVNYGADMVLRRAADISGKPVEGLETIESQLQMFTRLPSVAPAAAPKAGEPVDGPDQMASLSLAMTEMQSSWKRGDQAIFVQMLDNLRRGSPATYKMMFTERNSRWADWIAGRMQTPGTVFVAVGAGHLAGKDSLLVRLAEMGIESSRLD